MTDFELLFPTRTLKAVDLQGRDVVLTIRRVDKNASIETDRGPQRKHLMWFEEVHKKAEKAGRLDEEKRLILNVTQCRQIAKALDIREVESWPGHKITLYPTKCAGKKGEIVDCIRVRETAPSPATPQAPPADPLSDIPDSGDGPDESGI